MPENNSKLKTFVLYAVISLMAMIVTFPWVALAIPGPFPIPPSRLPPAIQGGSGGTGDVPTLDSGLFDLEAENLLETTDVVEILQRIIDALTFYIAPPVAVLMIIVGAFQMLSAGGDPEKFSKGKKTILYAAVGFAILLVADLLIGLAQEILGVQK